MFNSYLAFNFDLLHAATNNRYADGNDIRVFNLGPIALLSNYKLTTSSGKHLEDTNHANITFLMYKLITSSENSDDLSIGFEKGRNRRQREVTNNKNQKGKCHIRINLRDMFGFVEHQEKAIYGSGFKIPFTRNSDNAVLNKVNATNFSELKLIVLKGLHRNIIRGFLNKLYYLNTFKLKYLQSFNM